MMNVAKEFSGTRFRALQMVLVENEMCSAVSSIPLKTMTVFGAEKCSQWHYDFKERIG